MASLLQQRRTIVGKNGTCTFHRIVPSEFQRASTVRLHHFYRSERGLFGIDEKVVVLKKNWSSEGVYPLAESEQLDELEQKLDERLEKKLSAPLHRLGTLWFLSSHLGRVSLEMTRGEFTSPREEWKADAALKEMVEEEASRMGLCSLYAGRELLTGARSYGHHVHWSAGSPLETLLLYTAMRKELWRITVFSANSPLFGENGEVYAHCDRLGRTFVRSLVPKSYPMTTETVRTMEPHQQRMKKYPLLIHNSTGTIEVRASDVDVRSTAVVAYITLLLQSVQQEIAEQRHLSTQSDDLIERNLLAAKRYGLSPEGTIEIEREGSIHQVSLRQEMMQHYQHVIEPMVRTLQRRNGRSGIPLPVLNEMQSRIYDGMTPAQRQIDVYQRTRVRSSHREALIAAQNLNFFTGRNYFQ